MKPPGASMRSRRDRVPKTLRQAPARRAPLAGLRAHFDVAFPLAYAGLYALAGLCLALRFFPLGDVDLETDFYGDMVVAAQKLAAGEFSVRNYPYKGPFYSLPLIALHAVLGDWYRSAVVLNLLAAAASLVVTYRLLLALYSRTVAALATVLLSLVVDFFVHAHRATSDLVFLGLALGSVHLVCTGERSPRRLVGAGGLAGLAFLTRYNGVALPVGAAVVLLCVDPRVRPWWPRLRSVGLYASAFLVVCSPYLAASRHETGQILTSKNVQNLAMSLYPGPRFASAPLDSMQTMFDVLAYDPVQCARQYATNLVQHVVQDMRQLLGIPTALLAVAGAAGTLLGAASRAQWALYTFWIVYAALMGTIFYSPRFFFGLAPAYFASGLAVLLGTGKRLRLPWKRDPGAGATRSRLASAVQLGLVVVLVVAGGVQLHRILDIETKLYRRRALYVLPAARYLRERARSQTASETPLVMARKGHLALHSGLRYRPYPRMTVASLEKLLGFMDEHQVDYVAYGLVEYQTVPRLRFLAALDSIPGLEPVYRVVGMRIFQRTQRGSVPVISPRTQRRFLETNLRAAVLQREPDLVFRALDELAHLDLDEGRVADAAEHWRQALAAAERGGANDQLRRDAAVARHNLAVALVTGGQARQALPLLEGNLVYFQRGGSREDVEMTRGLLEICRTALADPASAASAGRQASSLARPAGDPTAADSTRGSIPPAGAPGSGP